MVLLPLRTTTTTAHKSKSSPLSVLLLRFLVCLLFSLLHDFCISCHANGGIAPIPNWQASWTASQASSTVMTMIYKDCIVMLIQSPSSNVWKGCSGVNSPNKEAVVHGLQVEEVDVLASSSSTQQYSAPSPSWVSLPNQNRGQCTICAMTGLAVDVEHLYLRLKNECESYNLLKQHHLATTNTYTKKLASELQQNCLSAGSRPYGVQALFVGCDGITDVDDNDNDNIGYDVDNDNALCIYSMDPSGSWQSWSKGTAIGKFGPELRYLLGKKLKRKEQQQKQKKKRQEANDDTDPSNNGLEDAVECLMTCWKETCQQQDLNLCEPHEEDYTALIIKRRRQSSKPKPSLSSSVSSVSSSSSSPSSKVSDSAVVDAYWISNHRQQRRRNGQKRKFQCFSVPKSKLDEIADRVNTKVRNH